MEMRPNDLQVLAEVLRRNGYTVTRLEGLREVDSPKLTPKQERMKRAEKWLNNKNGKKIA